MQDTNVTQSVDDRLELLGRMVLIRRFEEKAAQLRAGGLIPGFLHPCIGQEAVAVGTCRVLGDGDVITSTHRGHGHMLARGADPARMYAELFARIDGYNHGKGGSLHMIDVDLGFLGANGIVGGGIPLAVGAALQLKRKAAARVAVAFFGDGATNEGAFHESLNLAALWKLPVIFICENNLYGEFTRQDEHQAIKDVADRAIAYGMPGGLFILPTFAPLNWDDARKNRAMNKPPGVVVDGNDVLAIRGTVGAAAALARSGGGPTLVEAKTYRHRGHFEGDMARYRPKEEVDYWMARDPIANLSSRLIGESAASDDDIRSIRDEVERRLDAAIEWAKQRQHPRPEDGMHDVFVETFEGAALR